MVYVPVHQQQQSRRSRELAEHLRAAIADYQAREPKLNSDEVRLALQSVTPGTGVSPAKRALIMASVVFAVLVAGVIAATAQARAEGRSVPVVWLVAGLAAGLGAIAILVARARSGD